MVQTFYFYDLETSGISSRHSRIMQFAGQRTSLDLKPIGEPHNFLIKITDDVLPDPEAALVTGITPQKTKSDGISEAEFLKIFHKEIVHPNTIFVGFNNIRFDDEFMRFIHYRNFYDAYEWQWQDGRSKWDILDVSRMARALRPEGIEWPFSPEGKATNALGALTAVNKLDHDSAHDALSDVNASIAVARLLRSKQPKLFDYLLTMRSKDQVSKLVTSSQPFVYSSGQYSSEYLKTTVATHLSDAPGKQGVLVYDLRYDPQTINNLSVAELSKRFFPSRESELERLPVKVLQYNRCPAISPMGALDEKSQKRLKINMGEIKNNYKKLLALEDFADKIRAAYELATKKEQTELTINSLTVDEQLYDGFINDSDKTKMRVVRAADANELADLNLGFADDRLTALLPLYKARNFPSSLTADEQEKWLEFCKQKLLGGKQPWAQAYFKRLGELAEQKGLSEQQKYLLEELQLYGQSILPLDI